MSAEVAYELQRARQDELLRRRLSGDIFTRSEFHRGRLERAGLGRKGVRSRKDLARLAPMGLDDVDSPGALFMQHKASSGKRYTPSLCSPAEPAPLAYSAQDLELLAELGAEVMTRAGLKRGDVLFDLTEVSALRDRMQIGSGARAAGLSVIAAGPEVDLGDVTALDPSAVAGDARVVIALLTACVKAGEKAPNLHTAVVTGNPANVRRQHQLTDLARAVGVEVVNMWAPSGVMAAWSSCRGGEGLHTHPEHELVEVVDLVSGLAVPDGSPGRVLWTGLDWYATGVIRLQTDFVARELQEVCAACGRHAFRLQPVAGTPSFCDVLDEIAGPQGWAAELHRTSVGDDELFIWMATADAAVSLRVMAEVATRIGTAEVHVVEQEEIDKKVEAARGERFGDRRAFSL